MFIQEKGPARDKPYRRLEVHSLKDSRRFRYERFAVHFNCPFREFALSERIL